MSAAASPYGEYLTRLSRINPTDYQDPGTQEYLGALAGPLDDLVIRARSVMLMRLVLSAPEEALLLLGEERGIRRYPQEPLSTYRRRVQGAWEYWRWAGTPTGLRRALADAGYQAVITEHYTDPDPARWAEFSVAVSPLHPLPANAAWNSQTTWGSGAHWGINPNAVPTQWLPDLIREVKPAHARLRRLTYYPRARFWGGAADWGEGRDLPIPQVGWGQWTGVQGPQPQDRTDSGPAWGESDADIIYQLEE
ncbi:phage tail protein [Deinococcus sp. 6GRE01]|uniref:phage tail protein n=1 Tax=Deinococcus sp. 6GRE01 TaxID=2745873 RepID=UPI001E4C13B3|nr:hypothetical protein [Deinococcus sp. 6GRE01]